VCLGDAAHPVMLGPGYPYAGPYAWHWRTPSPPGRRIIAGSAPSWGQSAQTAADWPPSGEWCGRPSACAAFGGNLSLAWWLLRVAPQARCPRCQCGDVGMSGSVEAGIQRVLEEVGVTGFVPTAAPAPSACR
jgi:hypothetical protein